MTLRTIEGFGGSTTIANFQNNSPTQRWANTTWCSIQTAIGPRSTYGMRIAFDSVASGVASWGLDLRAAGGLGPLASGGALGCRMSFSSVSSGQYGAISFGNSDLSALEFTIQRASDGTVNVRRGDGATGTIVASSSADAIPADTFGYLEIKWNGIGTSKDVTVRWNGVAIITATSVNIQGGSGTHTCGGIGWFGRTDTQDLYLLDFTGSAPFTNFLGDMEVWSFLPTAATATGWTPSASTNLSRVNSNSAGRPSSATYNGAASNGLEDRFSFTPGMTGSRTILAVASRACLLQTVASAATAAGRLKSGATTSSGATGTPPITTSTYQTDLWLTNPNTSGPWTPAAVNALEVGYQTVSVGSGEVRATQVLLEALARASNSGLNLFVF